MTGPSPSTPGVHREDRTVAAVAGPVTGVPVFLGYAVQGPIGTPQPVDLWDQFVSVYGAGRPGFLGAAVRGFFGAGGTRCHVLALAPDRAPEDALSDGLAVLTAYENADLICVPDVVRDREGGLPPAPEQVRTMQRAVLDHCVQTVTGSRSWTRCPASAATRCSRKRPD